VPRKNLEETVVRQAKKVAVQRLSRTSQTMSLENQALSKKENEKILSELVNDIVNTLPSNLWNKT